MIVASVQSDIDGVAKWLHDVSLPYIRAGAALGVASAFDPKRTSTLRRPPLNVRLLTNEACSQLTRNSAYVDLSHGT